jgi:hypothetical protein
MTQQSTLEVTDRDGWRKEFPLRKSLMYVGSAPGNDITLEPGRGGGVASRHLQIIAIEGDGQRYCAINLGDTDVTLGDRPVAPRSAADIVNGTVVRLGDFTLTFRVDGASARVYPGPLAGSDGATAQPLRAAGATAAPEGTSSVIGLSLSLRSVMADPSHAVDGTITVRNLGSCPGVQFKLEVDGWDPGHYTIGPGPILFPNGEKDIPIRFLHPRGPSPVAGEYRIRVRATAPEAYPGESATVSEVLQIAPFYDHALRILP